MYPARIDDVMRLGPGERIVFRRDVPAPSELARLIASLANTEGGTIMLGLSGPQDLRGVRNAKRALSTVARAAELLQPSLLIQADSLSYGGKTLLTVEVPQGADAPYVTPDGHIWTRRGTRIVPADPERASLLAKRALQAAAFVPLARREGQRLQPKAASPSVDLEHILLKLERLIIANADLARKLDAANSWQSRITDQLLGAVIGLIVSMILFYTLGIG